MKQFQHDLLPVFLRQSVVIIYPPKCGLHGRVREQINNKYRPRFIIE